MNVPKTLESLKRCHHCGHHKERHPEAEACAESWCKCPLYEQRCGRCGHGASHHASSGACGAVMNPDNEGRQFTCRCSGFESGYISNSKHTEE